MVVVQRGGTKAESLLLLTNRGVSGRRKKKRQEGQPVRLHHRQRSKDVKFGANTAIFYKFNYKKTVNV